NDVTCVREYSADSVIAHEIVVVDDGSTDGTGRAAQALLGKVPALRVIEHPENRGYGAALKSGILAASAPVVGITDADGTYPNERLPDLHRTLLARRADM